LRDGEVADYPGGGGPATLRRRGRAGLGNAAVSPTLHGGDVHTWLSGTGAAIDPGA